MFPQFFKRRFGGAKRFLRRGQERRKADDSTLEREYEEYRRTASERRSGERKPDESILREQVDRDISAI
jgi:hypothetical protein